MSSYHDNSVRFAKALDADGRKIAARAIMFDSIAFRMAELITKTMSRMADLDVEPAAKLQIGAIAGFCMTEVKMLIGEFKAEGEKLKALLKEYS